MMRRASILRRGAKDGSALLACLVLCLVVPALAAGQSGQPNAASDGKSPPPATDQTKPETKPDRPRAAPPDARDRQRSGERIRRDLPVSFPVDI